MIDTLLNDLQTICKPLLPILGVLALIYMCILLRHLWKLADEVSDKVRKLDVTIDGVNQSLTKVQAPLDTVARLSHSVDKAQDKTEAMFKKASQWVNDNLHQAKEKTGLMEENTVIRQPGEEEAVSQKEMPEATLPVEEKAKEQGENDGRK